MKMYKYILFAATVIMAFACTKEIAPESDQNPVADLVPMTFTTVADTEEETLPSDSKVFYDAQTKTTQWKVGDPVKIVASNGNAYDFSVTEVNENGTSAIIKGEVNKSDEESDTFYAVYPASAFKGSDLAAPTNETKGARLYIDVPAVQTAVAGTFDPNAFVSIASSNGNVLEFKNLCSVVKFSFNNASDVKSVRFTMTGNTNLASCANVYVSNITSHTWGDAFDGRSASNMITLNAPAGGFKADTDYYFTLREFKQSDEKGKGFSFYIEYTDHYKVRSNATIALEAVKNKIQPMGALDVEGKIDYLSNYEAYNLGFDFIVAGKVYNKKSLNLTATLISENDQTISSDGIYFIDSNVENTNISKATYSKLFVIGDDYENRSKLNFSGQVCANASSTLAMKNIAVTSTSSEHLFVGYGLQNSPIERMAFDNCAFEMPATSGKSFMYNGTAKGFAAFVMHNSEVKVTGDSQKFIFIANNTESTENYGSVELYNNIFYSEADRKSFLIMQATTVVLKEFNITDNTFVNTYLDSNNGYVFLDSLTDKYTVDNNLFELGKYVDVITSNNRWILKCNNYPAVDNAYFNSGYFYAGTTTDRNMKFAHSKLNGALYPKDVSALKSSDFTNCIFVKKDNFKQYGATR